MRSIDKIIILLSLIVGVHVNAQYISPVFPKDGQMIYSDTVHFHWNQYLATTTYHLQVATDTAFTHLLINADVQGTDTIVKGFWQDTTFYWRLKPQGGTYGPCLRYIYFTPRMIPNLVGWYAADSCHMSLTGAIDTLYDKSVYHSHLIQSNTAKQPVKIEHDTSINNQLSIYFNGSKLMYSMNGNVFSSPNTYCFIWKNNSIITNNDYLVYISGKSSGQRHQIYVQKKRIGMFSGIELFNDTNTISIQNFDYSYFNACFNGSNTRMSMNTNTYWMGSGGSYSMKGLVLGAAYDMQTHNMDGYTPELIYYHAQLDSQQNSIVAQYLSEKYHGRLNLGENIASVSLCPITLQPDKEYVSYLWSTGDTTPSINVSIGKYWLTTVNRFGWKETDTINVYMNVPEVNDTIICYEDSVQWNYTQDYPYTFTWSNGQSGAFTTGTAGKYNVLLTDSLQCTCQLDFEIQVDSLPYRTAIMQEDSMCYGNTIELSYPRTAFGYDITWSTGDTNTITIPFTQTDWYKVQVTNELGCIGKDSVYIIKKGNAPLTAFTATNSCMGDSTAFTNTSTTNDGTHIALSEWYLGDGATHTPVNVMDSFKHLYDTSGLYIVTLHCVTDAGCEQEYRQSVSVYSFPQPDFTPAMACQNSPVTFANLTRSEYRVGNYTWHFTPQDSSVLAIPEFTFTDTGTYTVQLIAANVMGCTDSIAHTLYVKPNPQALFTHNTPCVGNTLYLNDITALPVEQKAVNRTWSVNGVQLEGTANHAQLPINKYGNYHALLHMQYLNGCHSMAEADIRVNPLPVADFTVSPVCQYDTIPIATAAATDLHYEWHYMGHTYCGTAPAIPADSTGRHTLTLYVYDANHCADSALQQVTVTPSPKADFTYDYAPQGLYTLQFTNHSQGADSYTWQFDNMGLSSEEHPVFDFLTAGTYMVSLTAANGGACTHEQKQQLVLPEHNVEVTLMDFRLMEQNGTVRPQVLVLNRSNRAIPLLQYAFTYNNERIYETDSISLPAGEMRQYTFRTAMAAKQQADYACITLATPYDSYQTMTTDREKCLLLHKGNFVQAPYPNPTDGKVKVCYGITEPGTITWQLHDAYGKLLYQQQEQVNHTGIYDKELDLSIYAQGVYILKTSIENEVYIFKIKKGE